MKKPHFAVFCNILCAITVLIMTACVMPVDISVFLEDEKVQDIIETYRESVTLIDNTANEHLQAGNGRITGLNPNRYYMVEEEDAAGNVIGFGFVTSAGTRNPNLSSIGRVTGGAIINLNNDHTYTVRDASPLTGTDITGLGTGTAHTSLTPITPPVVSAGGVLNIPGIASPNNYYLTLTATTIDNSWENIMVPISPGGANAPVNFPDTNIIQLPSANNTADYVFIDPSANINSVFRFIRVAVGTYTEPTVVINVSFNMTDGSLVLNPSTFSISQAQILGPAPSDITIAITGSYDSTLWRYNNVEITPNPGLTLDLKSNIMYSIIGTHVFVVEAVRNSIPYSAAITVIVNP